LSLSREATPLSYHTRDFPDKFLFKWFISFRKDEKSLKRQQAMKERMTDTK
jgi:hypothetical protein